MDYSELAEKLIKSREKVSPPPGGGELTASAFRFIKYFRARLMAAVRRLTLDTVILAPSARRGGWLITPAASPFFSRAPKRCEKCGRICRVVPAQVLYGVAVISKYLSHCHGANVSVLGAEIPELFQKMTWNDN